MEALEGKVFITGGAGTLGRAIINRATVEKWPCDITVFSTDAIKHINLQHRWPHVKSVIGDIRDASVLYNAMVGHDIVIHAAAVKHIPISEYASVDTYEINVGGSHNVASAAMQAGVKHVLGISTDKACHPANAYGATKMLMEKIWQEFARIPIKTQFHLVRYGNVLESTGSVVEVWKNALAAGQKVKITDPEMTRFWLSPSQAVQLVLDAIDPALRNSEILVPLLPSLPIRYLLLYSTGIDSDGDGVERIPMRPGEKLHETLLTSDEVRKSLWFNTETDLVWISPSTVEGRNPDLAYGHAYSSESSPHLTRHELQLLLDEPHV